MYKYFQSGELKKLMTGLSISSALVQFTFLVFPLSMYLVYNKVIASQNFHTIVIILTFLCTVLTIQYFLKKFSTIYQFAIKSDKDIKKQQEYIKYRFLTEEDDCYNSTDFESLTDDANKVVQKKLSDTYKFVLIFYFIFVAVIGKFLVIVPMLLFSFSFLIAEKIYQKSSKYKQDYNNYYFLKSNLIKEILSKIKIIKGLNVDDKLYECCYEIVSQANVAKCTSLYLQSMMGKISMIVNMSNIALMLLLGRYLYGVEVVSPGDIITCSILTIWIARPFGAILSSISSKADYSFKITEQATSSKYSNSDCSNNSGRDEYHDAFVGEVLHVLETEPVAYYSKEQISNHSDFYKNIKYYYKDTYVVETDIGILYGTVLDNITMFDKTKLEQAKKLIEKFELENLILALPYHINYVTTGSYDETIPYDLSIAIAIIRALIVKPSLVIFDIDINRVKNSLIKSMFEYAKNNDIKILCHKSRVSINQIVAAVKDEKLEVCK